MGIAINDYLVADGGVWKWRGDPGGSFSVKYIRSVIQEVSLEVDGDSDPFLWNRWATPKANILLWRALLGKVASKMGLSKRGVPIVDTACARCGHQEEDIDHIFLNCLWARCIWWNILAWMRISFVECNCFKEFIDIILQNPGDKVWKKIVYTIILASCWRIWSARNEKVFNNNFIPISKSVDVIKEDAFLWIKTRSKIKTASWEDWKAFDLLDML
ncbi:uncharacterized protein LOC118491158 [Helianthus annuus]|uniref:uncharacterized protein LOC118491158 n=1 Tax=Helianthus annuus TaxID=4232 RepID=UPI001653096A|nr:uncharacterized protein LOC118491158 [Helianthus annuus]